MIGALYIPHVFTNDPIATAGLVLLMLAVAALYMLAAVVPEGPTPGPGWTPRKSRVYRRAAMVDVYRVRG